MKPLVCLHRNLLGGLANDTTATSGAVRCYTELPLQPTCQSFSIRPPNASASLPPRPSGLLRLSSDMYLPSRNSCMIGTLQAVV